MPGWPEIHSRYRELLDKTNKAYSRCQDLLGFDTSQHQMSRCDRFLTDTTGKTPEQIEACLAWAQANAELKAEAKRLNM